MLKKFIIYIAILTISIFAISCENKDSGKSVKTISYFETLDYSDNNNNNPSVTPMTENIEEDKNLIGNASFEAKPSGTNTENTAIDKITPTITIQAANTQNESRNTKQDQDNIPTYNVKVDKIKKVEAAETYDSYINIFHSKVLPISINTNISLNAVPADTGSIRNYKEEAFNVFDYTYDLIDGCWKFTESQHRGFYLYSMNDEGNNSNFTKNSPKMRRCYLDQGLFQQEYLNTEDWFYAPFEDTKGYLYAECGKQPKYERENNDEVYIKKMCPDGKTIYKLCVGDYENDDLKYLGFAYIKKDVIAIIFNQSEEVKPLTQFLIINMKSNKVINKINLYDSINFNIKSDENHFIVPSSSFQRVYVFDTEKYKLVNTIDTTKCKELITYELDPYSEEGKYTKLGYEIDINDGKVYFLRHAGVFVTDCTKSEFYQLLDGSKYKDFLNQIFVYTSFYVKSDDNMYILGVSFDEESANKLWHYSR